MLWIAWYFELSHHLLVPECVIVCAEDW
jgi:hypothetical protein